MLILLFFFFFVFSCLATYPKKTISRFIVFLGYRCGVKKFQKYFGAAASNGFLSGQFGMDTDKLFEQLSNRPRQYNSEYVEHWSNLYLRAENSDSEPKTQCERQSGNNNTMLSRSMIQLYRQLVGTHPKLTAWEFMWYCFKMMAPKFYFHFCFFFWLRIYTLKRQ